MERNMKNNIILSFALTLTLALTCVPGYAALSSDNTGTSAAQFLKLGAGARAAGMGEAFTAVTDGADSVYWNPAGLNSVTRRNVSAMYASWLGDISYSWLAYAQPVGSYVVGGGMQYLSYGSINSLDSTGVETGSMSPSDMSLTAAVAGKMWGLDLGAGLKYINSKIQTRASAAAVDLGARYALNTRLTLGAVLRNFGSDVKYSGSSDPLPSALRVGASYLIMPAWRAALDVNAPRDGAAGLAAGTEYTMNLGGELSATGRAGYNTVGHATGGFNCFTFGAGVEWRSYTLDYAYAPYGDLGDTHRFSISARF